MAEQNMRLPQEDAAVTWKTSSSNGVSLPRCLLILIAAALSLATHLFTVSHAVPGVDLLVVTEHLPPYNYEENGIVKGVAVEVVQALLDEMGLRTEIQVLSWARAYVKALTEPNVLIFSMVRTPDRESLFHWIGRVSTTESYLFKRADREDIQIGRLEDARQYLIGTWREDVREQYLLSQGFVRQKQLDSSGTPIQNIQKLMLRRIDLVADSELSFYFQLNQLNYDPKLVTEAFKLEDISLPYYIALSKQTSPDLAHAFQLALERIKRKGIFDSIHQKYLGLVSQVPGIDP
jgi:polar amino acid transport system substrate-binding protein